MTEPTPRQLWVLCVYIETGSQIATAARLGITPDTVRNLLAATRTSLQARNTAQAFAIAVQAGLIDPISLSIRKAA